MSRGAAGRAEEEELPRMTLGEHLEELRTRLLKILVVLGLTFMACMAIYPQLVDFVLVPHRRASEMLGMKTRLIMESYTEQFMATVKLSFIVGLFLASPWIAYQIWAFVGAGLYRKERKYVLVFALPSFLLFTAGCVFGYFVMIPYGLWGLAQLLDPAEIEPVFSFSPYLSLVLLLTIIMGAIFEVPLVMLFLVKVGLVEPATYTRGRKFAIVAMFVIAAVLTPPDVITQIIMAIPLVLLYELGVILSKLAVRRRAGS